MKLKGSFDTKKSINTSIQIKVYNFVAEWILYVVTKQLTLHAYNMFKHILEICNVMCLCAVIDLEGGGGGGCLVYWKF